MAKRHPHQFPHMPTPPWTYTPSFVREENHLRRCQQRALQPVLAGRIRCNISPPPEIDAILSRALWCPDCMSVLYRYKYVGLKQVQCIVHGLLGTSRQPSSGMAGRTAGQSQELETFPPFTESFFPYAAARRYLSVREDYRTY